ncbi:GNAT family N-acetyltransferase [Deinococcus arcticus]|uniref:GNAT family N-acetyltransferase n=1 Tax=Deinococcus arcticus TaxID=2136176 RepID=A0A2T3W6E5_9DEIO|nr:GNAT family protein [Deinococcus arcticus]PTA67470.1 GNAT family N-acetyltransferase [Deinococcus arcticus]
MPSPALLLRARQPADLPVLWRWMHHERSPAWQQWDAPYFHAARPPSELGLEAYSDRALAQPPTPHLRILELGGQCVGQVSRSEEAPTGGGWWDLGILIFDPAHWGGGLGTRALQLWTAATFAETDAHVLTLTTWSGNERLIRAGVRAGYHECARIPQARLWQGQRWDSVKLACGARGRLKRNCNLPGMKIAHLISP